MSALLAFFGFWTTTLAAAAGAASVPIIIHLLNRRRYKIVVWAAMRFLLAAQKQNTRRLRLEQLLLLCLRICILLLLVFAMASVMPWMESLWAAIWPEGSGTSVSRGSRAHHVLVLDGSLSMNRKVGGRTAFDQAVQLALQKVRNAPAGDGFSVLLMKDNPVWIVSEPSQDHRRVAREIEALRCSHGNSAVPAVLNMVAAKMTEAAGRFPTQAAWFFTDLQRATWLAVPPPEPGKEKAGEKAAGGQERLLHSDLQKRGQTIFVDVGGEETGNLAVLDLRLEDGLVATGAEVHLRVALRNFGQEPRKDVNVELLAGKARREGGDGPLSLRVVGQKVLDSVKAGETVALQFKHTFAAAGSYALQVRVNADALEPDDARSVIVEVKDTVPILIVDGKPAPDRYDRGSEYLRLALNPFPPGAEPKELPLRPRVVSPAQFGDMNEGELAEFDVIYLCDVAQPGAGEIRRLETHLRRGGGVVFAMGDRSAAHLEVYDRLLYKNGTGLLPAKLEKKIVAPEEHFFTMQAEEEAFLEPPLRAFAGADDRLALRSGRFRQYLQARLADDARARQVLAFMPEVAPLSKVKVDTSLPVGDPALVEWNPPMQRKAGEVPNRGPLGQRLAPARYRGKVVLFPSTFNMDWTTWPGSPSFGAMQQEIARLAASGRLRDHAVLVGSFLEEYLPPAAGESEGLMHLPPPPPSPQNLKPLPARTQVFEDVHVFRWTDTDLSGIYRLVLDGGPSERIFAVNPPIATPDGRGSESDLTRVDQLKLKEAYPGWDFRIVPDPLGIVLARGNVDAADTFERSPVGPEIAKWALLLVLVLVLLEVILAWHFGHYSTVAGATEPAAVGWTVPLVVAVAAGLLFAAGAFILVQGQSSGDFLSFLPDTFRGWLESRGGIDPPPPGEGTRWNLESMNWLPAIVDDTWFVAFLALAAFALIFFIYRAEAPGVHPAYKFVLGGLRVFLVLLLLYVLLPRMQVRIDRQGWPELVVLIDDSRSMGEPDFFQDERVRARVKELAEPIRTTLKERLPRDIQALEAEIAALPGKNDAEKERLDARLQALRNQKNQIDSPGWRPTRLQLAQALLQRPEDDWLHRLLHERRMKLRIWHLDVNGRAIKLGDDKGVAGDVTDPSDPSQLERAKRAVAALAAEGQDSRLGAALRRVVDQYRGSSLAAVVMVTDGVATRDETIAQAADYAAQKGVPLFFVGIGDDHEVRDLRLHDLQVEDVVYVGDNIIFDARLTGSGYKDLKVDVVLKVKEKDGKEKELGRTNVKVDPTGKSVKLRLTHRPTEPGRRLFIVEVEPPKTERQEKAIPTANLRLERTIDIVETKTVKVLYVEGWPRYEFRFLKALLERESPEAKKKTKSVELKVVLLDADADFPAQDRTALADFPATRQELAQYDVVIIGDVDPRHPKLGDARLRMLADYVRGGDPKTKGRGGAGILFIAGPFHDPYSFKDTPLADVLPVEPLVGKAPAEPDIRTERLRLELTPIGRMHSIFRFSPNDAENQLVWQRLAPMFWWSGNYRLKPLAEVLAVHPSVKAPVRDPGHEGKLPLVVQQFVGSGRAMFFGFEETWRWRYREDEIRFDQFWLQTIRYLARGSIQRTDLRLDKQTPYRLGEPIKVTVRFPDNMPDLNQGARPDVKVLVEHRPKAGEGGNPEVDTLQLGKLEGSLNSFEGILNRTREGKYRFWLSTPDVSKNQPDGEKPSAEATVELPPGELDRLRMNQSEMVQAAEATEGRFYTLADADALLRDLPSGVRPSLDSPRPPILLWNHWLMFLLVLGLFSVEWVLRKRKHLL